MAPATTSPIKILSDLGYEVWEMESDADMLRALVDAINSLDPSDGRIPILQDAVKEIRGASRVAAPSKGMKVTEKKTRIKASKFIPRAKPAPKPKVSPVAMLPPAQEENQSIFAGLLNGLKGIASLLKNIAALLGIQFIFKKALAARKRRADALALKREREKGLEGDDQAGLGKKIKESVTKPIKSFWDSLLGFFKNIIFGSAVLGFYKWMKDPKNQETIKGISDWLSKNGEGVLKGILAILALGIGYRIYRIVSRVGKAIGRLAKVAGGLVKGGSRLIKNLLRLLTRGGAGALGGRRGFKLLLKGSTGARNLLGGAKNLIGGAKSLPKILKQKAFDLRFGKEIIDQAKASKDAFRLSDDALMNITQNLSKVGSKSDRAALNMGFSGSLKPKPKGGAALDDLAKFMKTDEFLKGARPGLEESSEEMIEKLLKGSVDTSTLDVSKSKLSKVGGTGQFVDDAAEMAAKKAKGVFAEVTTDSPRIGEKLLNVGGKKLATNTALKGTLKNVSRGLPLLGTYLDSVSAIEELKKGNFYAAGLFGIGAVTSIIPGMQGVSLGASIGGIAASIAEDATKKGPDLSKSSKKKEVKVTLVPTDMGEIGTSSGSGGTNSDIQEISSVDQGNDSLLSSVSLYGALNYA